MGHHGFLGEFEHVLLLAVLQLGDAAHGTALARILEEDAGRRVSRGALYSALDRLEQKGYLAWTVEPPTEDRGGHPRRLFAVTPEGLDALRSTHRVLRRLTAGLDDVIEDAR